MDINELKNKLEEAWCIETCAYSFRNGWSKDNPSYGQCAVTTLIVNDYFGGKIMRCMSSNGSHYYNLIDNNIIDLTSEQFLGENLDYEHGEERTREYLLSNVNTLNRYMLLNDKLNEVIKKDNMIKKMAK